MSPSVRSWHAERWRALVRERGIARAGVHVALTLARQLVGYARHRARPPGFFTFRGAAYPYLIHLHNFTWENERAVEVPIAWRAVRQARVRGDRVLEVGNVLGHYGRVKHDVLDRYERAPGVIQADVADWRPPHRYDLIVSVSTLEHVGWDEEPREPDKVVRAIRNLRSMLAPGGHLLVTLPIGHNPYLDRLLGEGRLPLDSLTFLKRPLEENRWTEATWDEVAGAPCWSGVRSATAIVVGWAGPLGCEP